jgi:hypothetical protein
MEHLGHKSCDVFSASNEHRQVMYTETEAELR